MVVSYRNIFLFLGVTSVFTIIYFNTSILTTTSSLIAESTTTSTQSDALSIDDQAAKVIPMNYQRNKDVHKHPQDVEKYMTMFQHPPINEKAGFKKFPGCGYVYSSYYDDRFEDGIRIIAFGYAQCSEFNCSLWYNRSHYVLGQGITKPMR